MAAPSAYKEVIQELEPRQENEKKQTSIETRISNWK